MLSLIRWSASPSKNFSRETAKYKPGLLIIDNPLLGLSVDSTNDENVKNGFYKYLINHQNYGQTIILQNSEKYELPKLDYKGHGVNVIFLASRMKDVMDSFLILGNKV